MALLLLGAAAVMGDGGDGIGAFDPKERAGLGDKASTSSDGGSPSALDTSFEEKACKCIGAEDKRSFGWKCYTWPAGPASFATTSPQDTERTPWCYVAASCPSKIAVSEESGDLRSIPETFPKWPHVYFRLGCPTAQQLQASRAMDELALMHELALEAKSGGVPGQGKPMHVTPPPTPYPATIDKALLMKDFYDAYFRPHGGFKYARGEQGACLADKALHLMDMLECTAANLAQLPESSAAARNTPGYAGETGNKQCSGTFVDGIRSASRECCSGLEHLPTWDAKKSCEADVAPAMLRLKGMAAGLRKCVEWLAQNSRAAQSLGDAASPAVCAHALFALPGAVNALFYAVHRRMAFDTSEEGNPIFGMAHVWQTRRFVITCAPKILEPKTHNELMSAAFSHKCRHMVNTLWQGLHKQSEKRERQARADEQQSRQQHESAARKRIAAQERAAAALRRSMTPAPTPMTKCPPGYRNIWSQSDYEGGATAATRLKCAREMVPHKLKPRTSAAPTPAPTPGILTTLAPKNAPTPIPTMKPHFEKLQQDDDAPSAAATTPRPTVAPHKQKPRTHKKATASPVAPAASPALRGGKTSATFASAADTAAAARYAQVVAQSAYGDDDDFQ